MRTALMKANLIWEKITVIPHYFYSRQIVTRTHMHNYIDSEQNFVVLLSRFVRQYLDI